MLLRCLVVQNVADVLGGGTLRPGLDVGSPPVAQTLVDDELPKGCHACEQEGEQEHRLTRM